MNPKHVDVRAYDSYLIEPDEDDIITIGVWGLYRLRLNMYAYAEQARISDFKHHLVFLQKIITGKIQCCQLILVLSVNGGTGRTECIFCR